MSTQGIDAAYARLNASMEGLSRGMDGLAVSAGKLQAIHENEKHMAVTFSSLYVSQLTARSMQLSNGYFLSPLTL